MRLLGVLVLCAFAAAVPTAIQKIDIGVEIPSSDALQTPESRNIFINALIRQLFAYIRYVINNGSVIFGLPPLDPLVLESYHLVLPASVINLDLNLKNAVMTGIGGFVVHTSNFLPREMSFDLDISVPRIIVEAGIRLPIRTEPSGGLQSNPLVMRGDLCPAVGQEYDLVGDLLLAIPLYGKGSARFELENLRFRGQVILKQSEDGKSVLIDKVLSAGYEVPSFKSKLTGVIGGGDIDQIVNAVIEDVLVDYSNRFQGAVAALVGAVLPAVANPVLEQLDTWKYIDIFV